MRLTQAEYLEIPVLSRIAQAESQQLIGMASCTAKQFSHWQGLLQELCALLVHVGPVGQAARQGFADQDYSALCTALTVPAAED